LGGQAEDFSYLIEQSKASAKDVRQAAYHALCKIANGESLAILIKGIDGKDLELVARAASGSKPLELVDAALDRAKKLLVEIPSKSDKKEQGDQVGRILQLISILRNPMKPEPRQFLRQCIEKSNELRKIKSTPGGLDIVESVVQALASDSESIDYLIQQRDHLPVECFHVILVQGMEVLPPKVFSRRSRLTSTVRRKRTRPNTAGMRLCERDCLVATNTIGDGSAKRHLSPWMSLG
jgi:hypothetical protein